MARIGEDTEVAPLPPNGIDHEGIGGEKTITIDPRINTRTETVGSADAIATDMSPPEQNDGVENDHIRGHAADLRARTAILAVTAVNDVLADPNLHPVPARLARTKIGRTDDLIGMEARFLTNDVYLPDTLPANAITRSLPPPPKNAPKFQTSQTL